MRHTIRRTFHRRYHPSPDRPAEASAGTASAAGADPHSNHPAGEEGTAGTAAAEADHSNRHFPVQAEGRTEAVRGEECIDPEGGNPEEEDLGEGSLEEGSLEEGSLRELDCEEEEGSSLRRAEVAPRDWGRRVVRIGGEAVGWVG